MKQVAFLCNQPVQVERVYGDGRFERVGSLAAVVEGVITRDSLRERVDELSQVEAVFSTWGLWPLEPEELDCLPALKAVFYAAGSVKAFARPLLDRNIKVFSSWAANAVPVAEFALAQILLSCKGYFSNTRQCRSPEQRHRGQVFRGPGVFGETVGLVGLGMVGQELARLLQGFQLKVVACDPYIDPERAGHLGIELIELDKVFQRAYVVSNHLPNLPHLAGVLHRELFRSMRPGATFINTGRGAQVDEAGLAIALAERPDLTALLDVTFPEPPKPDSPFYTLPNVQLSSHIAGSLNDELVRMADYMLEEFEAWSAAKPLRYQVTEDMLENMA